MFFSNNNFHINLASSIFWKQISVLGKIAATLIQFLHKTETNTGKHAICQELLALTSKLGSNFWIVLDLPLPSIVIYLISNTDFFGI